MHFKLTLRVPIMLSLSEEGRQIVTVERRGETILGEGSQTSGREGLRVEEREKLIIDGHLPRSEICSPSTP